MLSIGSYLHWGCHLICCRGQSVEQIDDERNELRSTVPVRRRCSRARWGLLQAAAVAGAFVLTQFADLRRAFRFASLLEIWT